MGPPPTLSTIAGAYEATGFTAGGVDVLSLGATLSLTLAEDGTVSGSLDVPPDAGGPFNADMAGTFVLDGHTVVFTQDGDSFVRDAVWTWAHGVLFGAYSGATGSAYVELER